MRDRSPPDRRHRRAQFRTSAPTPKRRGIDSLVERHGGVLVAAMIAAYIALFTVISAVKYRYYLYRDFDLAIFAQATDGILRGTLFSSIRGMHWLGDHSSLVLFVLAPLYAVFRHPLTLLVVQAVVLALGALAVRRLARRELGNDLWGATFAALYLMFPAIGYTNLFGFHPETLATTTLLFAWTFLREERGRLAVLFAALALLCKEDVAIVVLMMALVSVASPGRRGAALALAVLAIASLTLTFAVLKPAFSAGEASYAEMYAPWGRSLGEIAAAVVRHPLRAITALVAGDPIDTTVKRQYLLHMLAPLAFLPLLSPVTILVALPIVAEHLLSSRIQQHTIVYQYTALVTPFVVAAAVTGLANVWTRLRPRHSGQTQPSAPRTALAGLLVVTGIGCNWMFGPVIGHQTFQTIGRPHQNWPTAYDRALARGRDRMVGRVPRQGAVVADPELLSRFTDRANAHSAHHIVRGSYTFSSKRYPIPTDATALLVDLSQRSLLADWNSGTPARFDALIHGNHLVPVDASDGLVLFLRDATDTLALWSSREPPGAAAKRVVYDGEIALLGGGVDTARVAAGREIPLELEWQRVAGPAGRFVMTVELYDAQGRRVHALDRDLGYGVFPVGNWPLGAAVVEASHIVEPDDITPGTYTLGLRLSRRREGIRTDRPAAGGLIPCQPDDPDIQARGGLLPLTQIQIDPFVR